MTDRPPERRDRPVTYGLLALVGVATVVGLVMGLAALAGAKVLGVDGAEEASTGGAEASMYLPKPERTKAADGPAVTLAPGQETPAPEQSPTESETTQKPAKVISLSAGQTSVSPMQQIDLTGTYPGGEGAILQVQRFEGGSWTPFYSVTASVSDGTFSTYVQTGVPGSHRFRVIDTDTGKASNEVKVSISG